MSDTRAITRRASVKSLAFVGVAMASGIGAQAAPPAPSQEAPPAPQEGAASPEQSSRPADVALARFGKGHACSQAVFSTFAERMGVDYATAMKVASGFGGGMYAGSVCGAVTGAYMALGLKYGQDPNAPIAKIVREFAERFRAKHQSVNCADLIGVDLSRVDLSDPVAVKALKEKLMKEKNPIALCGSFVRDAAEIVEAMMKESRQGVAG